jgi:hypothetical protein
MNILCAMELVSEKAELDVEITFYRLKVGAQ